MIRTDNQIIEKCGYVWFSKQETEWIPYQGPDGGEGWQRVGDDEVRYQQNPPGETAEGVEENYWTDKYGADALSEFLDERLDEEEMREIGNRVEEAAESMNSDMDTEAGYIWGRLQHREEKFNQKLDDAPEGAISDLVDSIFGRREEEFSRREEMDELESLIEENGDMGTRDKLNISEAVREVQEDTDLTEEELRQDLLGMVEDADMPAEYVLDNAGLNAWKDSKRAEWRSENLNGEDAIELPEGFDESDVTTSDIYDAISATSVAPFQLPLNDYDPIPAVAQAMEDQFGDDPNKMYDEIEAFNNSLSGVLKPFSNTDIQAPDYLNPQNAEEVGKLEEYTDKTGRSASSMFVAKGVPDENGEERDLYITNTNRNREDAYAQDDADAARQILGSYGFQAAGFDSPDSYHEYGEFWVVEGADGDTADEFHVENDLDNPIEQFAELGATAAVIGAWDIHEGNVFINDGEFVPVDMDLAGAELHHNADYKRNRYRADLNSMMGLFSRMERLFERMNGGDSIEFDEIEEATKRRVAEMGENGTAQEIADEATSSITDRRLTSNLKANVRAMEENDYFEDYPTDDEPLDGFEEITDFSEGQVVEVTEQDRNPRSQEFEITETYDDHLEVTAVDDGAILGEGEKWNVSDPSEITEVFDDGDSENWEVREPDGYDEFSDFDPGQEIQVNTVDGTRNARVIGGGGDWLKVQSMNGEESWPVSDVSDITGILEPASDEESEDEPVFYEDFNDFDIAQEVEIMDDGKTYSGEVIGRRSHFIDVKDSSGNFHRVEDMNNVAGGRSEQDGDNQ